MRNLILDYTFLRDIKNKMELLKAKKSKLRNALNGLKGIDDEYSVEEIKEKLRKEIDGVSSLLVKFKHFNKMVEKISQLEKIKASVEEKYLNLNEINKDISSLKSKINKFIKEMDKLLDK